MAPFVDERRLDSADAMAALDSRQTLRSLATAGAQVRQSLTLAAEAGIERVNRGGRPRSVLVASLGGTAVVGDVLDALAEPGSPVPVTVRRNVPLPGWVGPLDLVIAVSQSGRASGPLALAAEAARRGAGLLTVGAPDSPLADVCARGHGVHVPVPSDGATSRTSLWSMLAPVLLGAGHLGLVDVGASVVEEVADRLDAQAEACRPTSEAFVNPAKVLAVDLGDTVPVVLGDGALTGVAAVRAAWMLARTARMPATSGELPDAASQVVACFDGPFAARAWAAPPEGGDRDIFADPYLDGPSGPQLGLLMLRDVLPDPLTPEAADAQNLAQAVIDSARDAHVKVAEAQAGEGHPLVRLADLFALTDFAATYLALGLGLDPAVSPHVADLRDRTS
jgi:glucose/mannose-6-phosphate isomerase